MEKPIKMDDLGIPFFLETPIWRFGSDDFHPLQREDFFGLNHSPFIFRGVYLEGE